MLAQQPGGGFTVSPGQVAPGGTVTIHGQPGETVYVLVPGHKAKAVKLDAKGRATIKAPFVPGEFAITDFRFPRPTERVVAVTNPLR